MQGVEQANGRTLSHLPSVASNGGCANVASKRCSMAPSAWRRLAEAARVDKNDHRSRCRATRRGHCHRRSGPGGGARWLSVTMVIRSPWSSPPAAAVGIKFPPWCKASPASAAVKVSFQD